MMNKGEDSVGGREQTTDDGDGCCGLVGRRRGGGIGGEDYDSRIEAACF